MLKTYATHFASIGGACWGLEQAGLECVSAIEYMQERVDVRKKNLGHEATCMNMWDYEPDMKDAADVLWTSPPCTMLSTASREYADPDHPMNSLYKKSLAYCKLCKPKFFILENVTGLLTHRDSKKRFTWEIWKRAFEELGYHVEFNVLNSMYFGIPQSRERVFMVGSLEGKKGLIPAEDMDVKITFESIMEKGSTQECYAQQTYWTILECIGRNSAKHGQEYPWKIVGADDLFINHTPALEPTKYNILPTLTCSFDGGATRKKLSVIDEVNGITFMRHPTVREGARAQGFPDTWVFPESRTKAWHFIGDAVSSPVSKALAEHIIALDAGKAPKRKRELTAKRIPGYVKERMYGSPGEMRVEMKDVNDPADHPVNTEHF